MFSCLWRRMHGHICDRGACDWDVGVTGERGEVRFGYFCTCEWDSAVRLTLLTQRLLWHSFEGACGKVEGWRHEGAATPGLRAAVNSPSLCDRTSPLCLARTTGTRGGNSWLVTHHRQALKLYRPGKLKLFFFFFFRYFMVTEFYKS